MVKKEEEEEFNHLQDTAAHHWYLISAVTGLPEMIIQEAKLINSGFPFRAIIAT